jgi:type IV secretory pathway component VirB8
MNNLIKPQSSIVVTKKTITDKTDASLNLQETLEYQKFIKESVANGSYFNDSVDWYLFRYVKPVSDRSMLFCIILIIGFIFYLIKSMLDVAYPAGHNRLKLPIVISQPLFIDFVDQGKYQPNLLPLKKTNINKNLTTDQIIINHFLSFFVKNFEEFDYSSANLALVNEKTDLVRNMSSYQVYTQFQKMMEKSTPNSPMLYFGKNYSRTININNIEFLYPQKKSGLKENIDHLLKKIIIQVKPEVPDSAIISFSDTVKTIDEFKRIKTINNNYRYWIKFKYSPISKYDKNFNFTILKYIQQK